MCLKENNDCFSVTKQVKGYEFTKQSPAVWTICPLSDGQYGEEDRRRRSGCEEDQEWTNLQVHNSQSAKQNSLPFSAYTVTATARWPEAFLCFINEPLSWIDLCMTQLRLDMLIYNTLFKFAILRPKSKKGKIFL